MNDSLRTMKKEKEYGEQFLSVSEYATDAIISARGNGEIIFWNKSAERIFGYTAEEALGKNVIIIIPGRYKEAHRTGIKRLCDTGKSAILGKIIELEGLRRDGSEFPLEISVYTWQSREGRLYTATIRDITERKKSEELIDALVKSTAGRWGQDFFDNIVWNLGKWLGADYAAIGEFEEAEKTIVHTLSMKNGEEVIHGGEYNLRDTPCEKVSTTGFCFYPREIIKLFPKDTALQTLHAESYVGVSLKDGEARAIGIIWAVSKKQMHLPPCTAEVFEIIAAKASAEIQRKRTEEDLISALLEAREATIRAEEAEKEQETFLLTVSHDLRTPLTTIIGSAEELLSKNLDKESRESAHHILSAGEFQLDLINNLLNLQRIKTGKIELTRRACNIGALLQWITSTLSRGQHNDGIELRCDYSPDKPLIAALDESKVKRILLNLINNAIKFTGNSVIYGMKPDDEKKFLIFYVTDNGKGIPAEKIDSIFKPFFQAESLPQQDDHATDLGLGLTICSKFAELHNGSISVESKKGATTFTLKIPFIAATLPHKESVENPCHDYSLMQDTNMLVVEDNIVNSHLLERLLKAQGCSVTVVNNGKHAYEYFTKYHKDIDVILMDRMMPVMNGDEATRKIRLYESNNGIYPTPILALSAKAIAGEREKCMKIGYSGHYTKPYNSKILFSGICEHISKSSAEKS